MNTESLVQKIVWGGEYANVLDGDGNPRCLVLRSPKPKDKQFIEFVYAQEIKEAQELGCVTGLELSKEYQAKGVWTHTDEDRIIEIKEKLKSLEASIKDERSIRKQAVLNKSHTGFKNALCELLDKRYTLFSQSAEKQAEGAKTRAIVYCSTFTEDDERYWRTWQDFQSEKDAKLIQNIITALNDIEQISNSKIREAARSGYWRIQWNAGKSVGDLFGCPIVELTTEQNALVYWSQMYDYVYEHPDKPPQEVIENDKALDAWFENQDRKKKVKDVTDGKGSSGVQLGSRVRRHGEIFIVANPHVNPNAPTTQTIEDLNDGLTRTFKQKEAERLKDKKLLRETEMRDRKNKIARKLIGSTDAVISKSSLAGRARGGKSAGKQYPGGTIG